jgi:hypothetical protein
LSLLATTGKMVNMLKLSKGAKVIVKKKIPISKKFRAGKVVSGMVANGGNLSKAIIAAGYSENTARTPSKVTNTEAFKEASLNILDKLKKIQEAQINELVKRCDNALSLEKYKDMVDTFEKTTKLVELLEGRATDRPDNLLNSDQLHELLSRRNKTTLPAR